MTTAVTVSEERFGGLDAIIAAAGVIAGGVPAWEVPLEQEQAMIDINLNGVLNAARVGIPALLRRPEPRSGRFVAVASAAAVRGCRCWRPTARPRPAWSDWCMHSARELRGTGVTANAVAPGSTDTPILDESARLYGLPAAETFASQQPIERLLAPEEIAAMLVWLAGEHAGGVTGALIPVDGGLTI